MFLWYDNVYMYAYELLAPASCRRCNEPATREFRFIDPSGFPRLSRPAEPYCTEHHPLNLKPAHDDGWSDEWKRRFIVDCEPTQNS